MPETARSTRARSVPTIPPVPIVRRAVAATALLVAGLASAAPASATPPVQQPPGDLLATYELVDTHENEPWQLRAGHVYSAVDVTSGPDDRLHVLDASRDFHALHTFGANGAPESAAVLDEGSNYHGVDAGPDGVLHALKCTMVHRDGQRETQCRIGGFDSGGRSLYAFQYVVADVWIRDIAVGHDGRIYLAVDDTRRDETYESSAIHVLATDGQLIDVIRVEDHFKVDHTVDPHYHVGLTALDVDADGRIHVAYVNRGCT